MAENREENMERKNDYLDRRKSEIKPIAKGDINIYYVLLVLFPVKNIAVQ